MAWSYVGIYYTYVEEYQMNRFETGMCTRARGFTLMEVVIVLVIIGIISIFAIPKMFSHYTDLRVLAAAKQIMADIRYAQTVAMSTHDSAWVEFDQGLNLYRIYKGPNQAGRTLIDNPMDNEDFVKYLDAGEYVDVTITALNLGSGNHIAFDWFGNTPDSGEVELNSTTKIKVRKYTGMVEIVGW